MKNFFSFISIISVFFCVSAAGAMDCEESNAMLGKAFADKPDEMTSQYIETAIQGCPENAELFERIGRYYEKWYKEELNPEKQAEYKKLAQTYYQKAIAAKEGGGSEEIKTQLAGLEKSREFNEVAFRALRPTAPGQTGSGLKLDVHFAFDSHALSDAAQKHLDVLGKILKEQPGIRISLEGHTDMAGPAAYNESLSFKRAKCARKYLMDNYGIEDDRILVAGFGFERLADKEDPYSEVNRRVEVIKISE